MERAAGKTNIDWCVNMSSSLDIGISWLTCEQPNAPETNGKLAMFY